MARDPEPQPRRRDAAVIIAMLLVGATIYLTVLGPLSGDTGWQTLLAIAVILVVLKLLDPAVRKLSKWVSGKGKRRE